jgi:DNA-directed RNA polymerase specialized sigma24 family protein
MNYRNNYDGIDPELVKIVKRTARRAIGKSGFTKSDLPDIEQELMLAALKGLKSRGKSVESEMAFARGIVTNQLNLLFRKQSRKMRKWQRHRLSLNVTIELDSGDPDELISLVDTDYLLRNNSCFIPDPYRDIDLAGNIKAVIETLPENFRELCEELKQKSVRELAREKKTSVKLTRREIAQVRKELKKREALSLFQAGPSPG